LHAIFAAKDNRLNRVEKYVLGRKLTVKPGKSGEIQITYDTSQLGFFNKTITVFYNGKDSPQTLTIKGRMRFGGDGD